MTDHDALLAAIIANPADDTARLVYADWLAENGEADRGEFIRIDIELARTPPGTNDDQRRRVALHTRRDELLKLHRANWLAPFVPHAKEVAFERGFVSSLDISSQTFLKHAERWFAITPLTRVKFSNCIVWDTDQGLYAPRAEVLASPLLGRLEVIDLSYTQITAASVERFAECPNLASLRELVLTSNQLQSAGARILARMHQLKDLESLNLVSNGINDSGARAIAESPHFTGLKELRISRNPIRTKTWTALEMRFGSALVG
jgi:uncharacterized protein (TIGR02996 family)